MKKWIGIAALVLLVFFVVTRPDEAASTGQGLGSSLREGGDQVITFLTELTNG